MKTKWMLYKELELIPDSVLEPGSDLDSDLEIESRLNSIWESLEEILNRECEPEVWQTTDAFNYSWWHIYDSITDQTIHFASEWEVRTWLNQYYSF